jgi:hypothetical protein
MAHHLHGDQGRYGDVRAVLLVFISARREEFETHLLQELEVATWDIALATLATDKTYITACEWWAAEKLFGMKPFMLRMVEGHLQPYLRHDRDSEARAMTHVTAASLRALPQDRQEFMLLFTGGDHFDVLTLLPLTSASTGAPVPPPPAAPQLPVRPGSPQLPVRAVPLPASASSSLMSPMPTGVAAPQPALVSAMLPFKSLALAAMVGAASPPALAGVGAVGSKRGLGTRPSISASDGGGGEDSGEDSAGSTGAVQTRLSARRNTYTPEQKRTCLNERNRHATAAAAVRAIRGISGFEKVTESMLACWGRPKVPKKRGRIVRGTFEQQVLDSVLMVVTKDDKVEVVANAMLTYAIIQQAAREVQQLPDYATDRLVQGLKFTDKWVTAFLERHGLRRRRITHASTLPPPADEVRAALKRITDVVTDFPPEDIFNADETRLTTGTPEYT